MAGRTRILAALAAVALAAGCAGPAPPGEIGHNKTTAGALIGGVGGAVAGAQFGSGSGQLVGVAAGALIGALIGSEVGRSLDRADLAYAHQAHARAVSAPIGERIVWANPETGRGGDVVAVRDGYDRYSGAYCREFQQTIRIGGQVQQGYGTACRQPDGSWRIVN